MPHRLRSGDATRTASWPGSTRPSIFFAKSLGLMDARLKSGHGGLMR
jgi:hypothetical protein